MHGERDTLGATVELMAMHTRAVARGAPDKLIIADMPFLTVRKGSAAAVEAAGELMRAGAHGVKIEGVRGHGDVVRHLVESGIPVMGHLGLLPQSVYSIGGYKVQGKGTEAANALLRDAKELERAGAFSVVLECIPRKLATRISKALRVPTIGIGAGPDCGGQVLVLHDLLGFNAHFQPRHVRRFAEGAAVFREGVDDYARAVQRGQFPGGRECF
jgi:3-methyl-2-oxobutanoate hydroxymethyltransferase